MDQHQNFQIDKGKSRKLEKSIMIKPTPKLGQFLITLKNMIDTMAIKVCNRLDKYEMKIQTYRREQRQKADKAFY